MIPVYRPWLTELEKRYLNVTVDTSWISSAGKFIQQAEEMFADFIGTKHCVLTSSGTTALHLSLLSARLGEGAIIVPTLTFAATAFAASYCGRDIIFVDADPKTWNLDLDQVERTCQSTKIAAVIPVHLYGNPVDMIKLQELQKEHGFKIVEDACESIDAKIDGVRTGKFSDVACFSFYGNKTLTSGEGGALVTDSDEIAERARVLRGQAQDPEKRYWHVDVGYNYRMTNMQAAILTAQLERVDEILAEKKRVAEEYKRLLNLEFQEVMSGHEHSYWLISLKTPAKFDVLAPLMRFQGVDIRPVFYPMTDMPPYYNPVKGLVATELSEYGISLPSYPQLTNKEIAKVCRALTSSLKSLKN